MKKLYVMPTTHCNLSCSHCRIKNAPETYNREVFLEQLNNFDGILSLFGGEPTIYKDRLFDIIVSNNSFGKNKISGISTNLINLDEDLLTFYSKIKYISTSWNLNRFTPNQYEFWLGNCNKLEEKNVSSLVLITITPDLIYHPIDQFISTVSQWNSKVIHHIQFEHYIGDNDREYYRQADEWLSRVCEQWISPINIKTVNQLNRWYFHCNDFYTLLPNGEMYRSCPNGLYIKPQVPKECLTCPRANNCRPCKLHKHCSYPKHMSEIVNEKERTKC